MARRNRQGVSAGSPGWGSAPVCALITALLLTACATVPRGTVRERDEFSALGGGAILYLRVDTKAARPILDAIARRIPTGVDKGRTAELLDRTDTAAIALFGAESPRRYLVAARGRYPTGRAAFSLALNSAWKKESTASGERYWRSRAGLSLAFRKDSALISDGEPFANGTQPNRPVAYSSDIAGELLSGWVAEPAARLSDLLGEVGALIRLPITELVFALIREGGDERYRLETRLVAPSPERARSLAVILSLARSALDGDSSRSGPLMTLLFASPPVLDGATLIVRSLPMTSDEIALLCATISIHLRQ